MRIDPTPDFYLVVPDIHTNAQEIFIYKVIDQTTKEVVKQIPSQQEIVLIEHIAQVKNQLFREWGKA